MENRNLFKLVIKCALTLSLLFITFPSIAIAQDNSITKTSKETEVTQHKTNSELPDKNINNADSNTKNQTKDNYNKKNISNSNFTATVTSSELYCNLILKNFTIQNKAVKVAVWTEKNKQADLKWYTLNKVNDEYTYSIPILDYRSAGLYNVHAYYVGLNGKDVFCNYTTFSIKEINGQLVSDNINYNIGSFDANVTNIDSPSGIYSVNFKTWPKGSSNIRSFSGSKKSDSPLQYYSQINMNNWNYFGTYQTSATITAVNGVTKTFNAIDIVMKLSFSNFSATLTNDEKNIEVNLNNLILPNWVDMKFAVWSEKDGQDDLIWYKPNKDNTNYTYDVPVSNHKSTGKYQVHAVIKNSEVSDLTFAATDCIVSEITKSSFSIIEKHLDEGKFKISLKGIKSTSGITKVEFPTWTKEKGQDDIVWGNGNIKQNADGTYDAEYTINISEHNYQLGVYVIHAYVVSGNGIKTLCGYLEENVSIQFESFNVSLNSSETFVNLELTNAYIPNNYNLYFAVWSANKGQDDLRLYETKAIDGIYKNSINLLNHRDFGTFNAHVIIKDTNGKQTTITGTTFYVQPAKSSDIVTVSHIENGYFTIELNNIVAPSGIYEAKFAVWTEPNGQDDLHWYKAQLYKNSDSSYKAVYNVYISNHNNYQGIYNIHSYVTAINGAINFTRGQQKSIGMDYGKLSAQVSPNELYINILLSNTQLFSGSTIRFAVWSEKGGQPKLKWYQGIKDGNNYKYDVGILDFRDLGKYNIHTYLDYNGESKLIAATTIEYKTKFKFDFKSNNIDQQKGTFDLTSYNVQSPSGVYKIKCPTWRSTSSSGSSIWYEAQKRGNDYIATADVADHEFYFGKYTTHVYVTMTNGVELLAKIYETEIQPHNYFGLKYQGSSIYKMCIDGFDDTSFTTVKFPTWSTPNGQDDIQWYVGKKITSKRWTCEYSARVHWPAGEFNTHVYAYSPSHPNGKLIAYKVYNVPEEAVAKKIEPLWGQKKGVDVSEHNGNIDWVTVANSREVGYAMIRAGFRNTRADYKFYQNYDGARANNIAVGVYWYSYAQSVAEAQQEAYKCLEVLGGRSLDLPVAFDLEQYPQLSSDLNTAMINAFCDIIAAHGYTPMVYASESWYNGKFNVYGLHGNIYFWVAKWSSYSPSIGRSEFMRIWQNSSYGSVAGIPTRVDTNWLYY